MYQNIKAEANRHLTILYELKDTTAALGYLFNLIENALHEHNLFMVDAILEQFNPYKVDTIISTGLARVTSRARQRLPSWITCICKIKKTCISRGEDASHLLRGLIKDST